MIWARRAALNGNQLDEIDNAIVIRGIEQAAGKDTLTAGSTGGPFGMRITGARRDSLDITLRFAIDIKKNDLEGRSAVLEAVNAWAAAASRENGGAWLTVGHKPDRRIRVVLAQPAPEGDLWKWTEDFPIIFRAYGVPYWEQSEANTTSTDGNASGAYGAITIGGSAVTQVNAYLKNTSGAGINTATVNIGGKNMGFSTLGLAADETLTIDHTGDGLVRIRIRSSGGTYRSAMANRTPESADDFTVMPGARECSFSAQRACKLTVEWRDRYL